MKPYKLELCCENIEQAIKASPFVDQIEFCAALDQDGLTPSVEDVLKVKSHTSILIKVIIRNRAGNFIYNEDDIQTMLLQADAFKKIGISHFVFGALGIDGRLDIDLIKRFAAHVYPAWVCVHKAIDLSVNILEDVNQLMQIENINSILSSGGCETALKGQIMLKKMIALADKHIDIIAAGKITPQNIWELHNFIHAKFYHGKAIITY